MKIVLSGCTGFIGNHLMKELALEGHQLVSLTRRREHSGLFAAPNLRYISWGGSDGGSLVRHVDGADAVINLAGESIAKGRWNDARKHVLVESRVGPTASIVEAIANATSKPKVLVNASAVGYYGNVDDGEVPEEYPSGEGFLASLCVKWESEAKKAASFGVRAVMLRIAFVVGGKGSALGKMTLPFKLFVGGPIGTGRQWFPWVHVSDVTGIARYALTAEHLHGPVNAVAPEYVRMKEFCAALGKAMRRPSWAPVPAFAVRLMLGEMADMILGGQKVVPSTLQKAGYRFRYPELGNALVDALRES